MSYKLPKINEYSAKKSMKELENPEYISQVLDSIDPNLMEKVLHFGTNKDHIKYAAALTFDSLRKSGKLPLPIEIETLNQVTEEILTGGLETVIINSKKSILFRMINEYARLQEWNSVALVYSVAFMIRTFEKQGEKYSLAN